MYHHHHNNNKNNHESAHDINPNTHNNNRTADATNTTTHCGGGVQRGIQLLRKHVFIGISRLPRLPSTDGRKTFCGADTRTNWC